MCQCSTAMIVKVHGDDSSLKETATNCMYFDSSHSDIPEVKIQEPTMYPTFENLHYKTSEVFTYVKQQVSCISRVAFN